MRASSRTEEMASCLSSSLGEGLGGGGKGIEREDEGRERGKGV